jgi:hypothetical protein
MILCSSLYIYLSPPLIFPTTYNGIRTKNRPVWFTPALLPYVEWDRFVTLAGSIHDVVWCLVNHQKKSSNKHLCTITDYDIVFQSSITLWTNIYCCTFYCLNKNRASFVHRLSGCPCVWSKLHFDLVTCTNQPV